jgi:hypothetical protein
MEEAQPQGASPVDAAEDPHESDVSLVLVCAASVFCDESRQTFSTRLSQTEDPASQAVVNLAGVPDYFGLKGDSPTGTASKTGRAVIWVAVMAVLIVGGLVIANAAT